MPRYKSALARKHGVSTTVPIFNANALRAD
jgi:hypothetical protein